MYNSGGNLIDGAFFGPAGMMTGSTSIAAGYVIPNTGVSMYLKNFSGRLTTATGNSDTRTFTLQLNGVDTVLQFTISGANTTGSVGTVLPVSGFDYISVRHDTDPGFSGAASVGSVSYRITSTP